MSVVHRSDPCGISCMALCLGQRWCFGSILEVLVELPFYGVHCQSNILGLANVAYVIK